MPRSIPRPCAQPGCRELVLGACRCPQHATQAKREADSRRPSARVRGYSGAWERARAEFLRANPLCAECARNDQIVAATVVDHVVPHKGDKQRFWDRANWQPLCKRCHDRKTAREQSHSAPGGP